MTGTTRQIAQLTFSAVLGYLVLVHYKGGVALAGAVSKLYSGGVKTLQGR
jgi:hypothetical protein